MSAMKRNRLTFCSREEWLAARCEGIGASEVSTIIGVNPFETAYQLWRRKKGIDPAKQENFAMKAGHYLEDAVARFWSDETGCEIIKASVEDFMFVNHDKPYMRVSPDRTFWLPDMAHNDDNKGLLECKTTQMSVDRDDIPKHWYCQVQYQLGVSNYNVGSIAWLSSGREFGYKDIAFDPDFYAWIEEEVTRFWVDYVLGDKEPDPVSASDVLLKYSSHTDGKSIEVSDDIFVAYTSLKDVKAELSKLDERKTELEDKIKASFADAESISFGGQTLATWKSAKSSAKFDDKSFKADHPELVAQYMKTVPGSRRFLLK